MKVCHVIRTLFKTDTMTQDTVMRHLTGIRSEKCVVRRFRRCANAIERTYTNLYSKAYNTLGQMV